MSQNQTEKSVSKGMFGNRGKMTKKDMQNNMRAMLAKTKVADNVVTSQTAAVSSSGYVAKRNFQPAKNKSNTASNNKSSNQANKRTSSLRQSGAALEKSSQ